MKTSFELVAEARGRQGKGASRRLRHEGKVPAIDSPIGRLPQTSDLNLDGIDVPQEDLDALFEIDPALWLQETDLTEEFYRTFDGKIPPALYAELAALRYRLKAAQEA